MSRGEPPSRKFSDASTLGYSAREVAKQEKEAGIATTAIDGAASIVRELVHASMSNPLIGILVAFITVDVLEQAGVIRPQTSNLMVKVIMIAFGVEVTIDVAEAATSILSGTIGAIFGGGGGAQVDASKLIAPQAQTLVMNPPPPPTGAPASSGATGVLGALAKTLVKS